MSTERIEIPQQLPQQRFTRQAVIIVDGILPTVHHRAHTGLRITLGLIYIWFGALKMAGDSDVAALVSRTVPWFDPSWFIPALGGFEVFLGLWLITGRALLVALPLFVGHMLGTLSVLVIVPDAAYHNGNPLLLTMQGEFVLKNLVLLAAGIAVITHRPRSEVRRGQVSSLGGISP